MTELAAELTRLTCDLIRFETIASRPDQLQAAIDYVADYLADIPSIFVEKSSAEGKPALVVTLHPTRSPRLMLNGHLDVVVGQPHQFVPEVRDGRIYGRGSQDMKGSIAVMMRLIRDLASLPHPPDVGFQFVTDEEIGGRHGTGRLRDEGWQCSFMLCLEPTDLGIMFEHKGGMWAQLRIPGRAAHGSRPWEGDNPVYRLMQGIQAMTERYPPPIGPQDWRTSVTPTEIHVGAGSRNQVPAEAFVTFDIRWTADTTPEAIQTDLAAAFPTAEFVNVLASAGLNTDPEHHEVERIASLIERYTGQTPRFYREHFATDARYYSHLGVPAICLGPVGAGLHSAEEWVEIDSLVTLYRLITDYCTAF
ncbi:M20 family metallopeptidase [Chloroflexus sp.]|uniref:M20 family metallopeptidase n=1 Tax=Chloroflexus sp. TaxID=1904827 RepID=UPI00262D7E65|nr:M20/M25/M40 family metallo-hydrolase [uncultured Chloroflexus sp.]